MIESLFNSSTISLLEKVAVFGEKRQQVLAGNIANFDTPNYKTRDLPVEDFQQALKAAVEQRHKITTPQSALQFSTQTSAEKTERDLFPEELFQAVEASPQNITFQDGNNRSVEHEMMEMTKNTMMQNYAIELMRTQMAMMQMVISERL